MAVRAIQKLIKNTVLLSELTKRLALGGDTNLDGVVSFADFLALSANFGKDAFEVGWEHGDFIGGGVTFEDFVLLSKNFGASRPDREGSDLALVFENFGEDSAVWADGDLDNDRLVGFRDFLLASGEFGANRVIGDRSLGTKS